VNAHQKSVLFDKLRSHYGGSLQGKTIALGPRVQANTDDMREASSGS